MINRRTILASALALISGSASGGESLDLAARLRAEAGLHTDLAALSAGPQPLTASMLLQTRYMADFRSERVLPNNDDYTIGFTIPRAEIRLNANVFNEQLLAHISFDFGDAEGDRGRGDVPAIEGGTGSAQLRQAYAQYNFSGQQEGYYFKAGQWRTTLLTEESIAPEYQLAVERSVSNEFFAPGNTQGVALGRVRDRVAWEVSFNDGIRYLGNPDPLNTDYTSVLEADWAVSYRLDWKFAGDWTRFQDFTSWRGEDEAFRVGAGIHLQRQGDTNPGDIDQDYLAFDAQDAIVWLWTIDAHYEGDGWSVFAAYTGNRIEAEFEDPSLTLKLIQHGWLVQGSIFLMDPVEIFARYDGLRIDTDLVDGFLTEQEIYHFFTVGLNYYPIPESHAVKLGFDLTAALSTPDTLNAGANTGNSIFLPDPTVTGLLGATDEEWLLRAQLQLVF